MPNQARPKGAGIVAHRDRMLATGHSLADVTLRQEAHSVLQRIALRTGLTPRAVVDRLLRHPQAGAMIRANHV